MHFSNIIQIVDRDLVEIAYGILKLAYGINKLTYLIPQLSY